MPPQAEQAKDPRKTALEAAETLMHFRTFLPRGGLLLMLVSRFRDDLRDALGMARERVPGSGRHFRSLDEMTSTEFDRVTAAVATLLEDRFAPLMDDPALPTLLREFQGELSKQATERAADRAKIDAKAIAS
jgi:hypothetical protein